MLSAGLVERAKANDSNAFAELYQHTVTPVYRYLSARVSAPEEAEELTQEVYLAALQGLGRFRGGDQSALFAWLFQIARNKLADHLRRRYQRPSARLDEAGFLPDKAPGPEEEAMKGEDVQAVRQALGQLTQDHREVMVYKYVLGYDNAETARLVGRNTNAVNQLHHRALRSLQRVLSSSGRAGRSEESQRGEAGI